MLNENLSDILSENKVVAIIEMNLELLGYFSIAFGVFVVRCEIFLLESSNYLGQIVKFSSDEQWFECTQRSYFEIYENKSDLEN